MKQITLLNALVYVSKMMGKGYPTLRQAKLLIEKTQKHCALNVKG